MLKYIFCVLLSLIITNCSNDNNSSITSSDSDSDNTSALDNDFVLIKKSDVKLGNNDTINYDRDEYPAHTVKITDFKINEYEVTNNDVCEILSWVFDGNNLSQKDTVYESKSTSSNIVMLTYQLSRNSLIKYKNSMLYYKDSIIFEIDSSYITSTQTAVFDSSNSDTIYKYITQIEFEPLSAFINYPAVNISWLGAVIMCNLKSTKNDLDPYYVIDSLYKITLNTQNNSYRLPTEAEWEKAARGNMDFDSSKYPTGNTISIHKANFSNPSISYLNITGYYDPNNYGLYDMAGNVWEWCMDSYDANYYESLISTIEKNPVNHSSDNLNKVIRGGSFLDKTNIIRTSNRYYKNMHVKAKNIGFRIVKDM